MTDADANTGNGLDPKGIEEIFAHQGNLLRTLIDNLPDFIYAKDVKSRFTLNNMAHLRELGADNPEAVLGKTDYDFFDKDMADQYSADEQEVMRSGKALVNREETATDQEGKTQWLLTTKVPLRDDGGNIVGIIGISRDITDRRKADLLLERQVELQSLVALVSSHFIDVPFEGIENAIRHGLAVVGGYAKADRSYVLAFGENGKAVSNIYEWCASGIPSQVPQRQGLTPSQALPWLSKAVAAEGLIRIPDVTALPDEAAAERTFFTAAEIRSTIWVPMSSGGWPVGYLGFDSVRRANEWSREVIVLLEAMSRIFVNALSRKMHLEALDRERNFMTTLMDHIPDAIYFKDSESHFMRISKAQANLFGLESAAEGKGKSDFDFFTEEHAQQAYEDEQEIIRTGEPVVGKIEKETWPDRPESWVSTTKMPFVNSQGKIVGTFGISRNVTEQKLMEKEIEEHAELLEAANSELEVRNQELDEFSYVASHDLQEPLRKLTAFSDLLREDMTAGDQDEVLHDLDVLSSAAQRMQTLVQDLLALSRSGRQSMTVEPLDVDEIVDIALDVLELRIEEEDARITRTPMPKLNGDRTLLTQLFQNLIGNALKFHGAERPRIELSAREQDDGAWWFGVRDHGIGLRPEYAEQIFAPFKRLHGRGAYEGTGIGLAICRKIVERHGGKIWVESKLDEGAHFQFVLRPSLEEEDQ